jgi:Dual specificity phosphatase, catalytic domain
MRWRQPARLRLLILLVLLAGALGAWLFLVALERSYRERENYSFIEEGLAMGGDAPQPPRGTRAVLNLCEKEDGYRSEVYAWEPIRDGPPAPDLAWLRRMGDFVDTQRRAGRPVFVHCYSGVSRSGMVVTAYEMFKNHWTRDEALEFVRSKRPATRPNPAFMELLGEWEQALKEQPAKGEPAKATGGD